MWFKIRGLYWRIRYTLVEKYFKLRYAGKPRDIYYDKWFKCYVHSRLTEERGSIDYVLSELTRSGLIYHYYIGDKVGHSHSIEGVMQRAYEEADTFKLLLDYDEYSKQEIELIEKIVAFRRNELKG